MAPLILPRKGGGVFPDFDVCNLAVWIFFDVVWVVSIVTKTIRGAAYLTKVIIQTKTQLSGWKLRRYREKTEVYYAIQFRL